MTIIDLYECGLLNSVQHSFSCQEGDVQGAANGDYGNKMNADQLLIFSNAGRGFFQCGIFHQLVCSKTVTLERIEVTILLTCALKEMEETIIESQCVLLGPVEQIWCVNRESGEHDILCCLNGPFLQVYDKYVISLFCVQRELTTTMLMLLCFMRSTSFLGDKKT
jgi:hypothetical protein